MSSFSSTPRRYCPDCVEDYFSESDCCLVCGAQLVTMPYPQQHSSPQETNRGDNLEEENLSSYLDLFGIDFRELLERFQSSSHNREITQDYASTLGKVDVDERFTILFNGVIRIGPLKVNSVPANFSMLSLDAIYAPLVISDPVYGDCDLINSDQVRGSIVLMERGSVTFAQKCKHATTCGAVGIIIAQTDSKWPFVMGDSSGELEGSMVDIPVCMVSQSDGELLFKWVRSKSSSAANTNIIFKIEPLSKECSICQDQMSPGENVLRLSCCHSFHSECIMTWLKKNNNCPMCRYEMPSVPVERKVPHERQDTERNNMRQSYFA